MFLGIYTNSPYLESVFRRICSHPYQAGLPFLPASRIDVGRFIYHSRNYNFDPAHDSSDSTFEPVRSVRPSWKLIGCTLGFLSLVLSTISQEVAESEKWPFQIDFLPSDGGVWEVRPSRGIFVKRATAHVVKPLQSRRGITNNDRHQLDA